MEMTSKAIGRLAMAGDNFTAEYVEFEVKRALEWLGGDRNEGRRHAAVRLSSLGNSDGSFCVWGKWWPWSGHSRGQSGIGNTNPRQAHHGTAFFILHGFTSIPVLQKSCLPMKLKSSTPLWACVIERWGINVQSEMVFKESVDICIDRKHQVLLPLYRDGPCVWVCMCSGIGGEGCCQLENLPVSISAYVLPLFLPLFLSTPTFQVLVLRELAISVPTFFFQQVQPFFDNIFVAVWDPKQAIREGAVAALRACLILTTQRESKEMQKPQWYRVRGGSVCALGRGGIPSSCPGNGHYLQWDSLESRAVVLRQGRWAFFVHS